MKLFTIRTCQRWGSPLAVFFLSLLVPNRGPAAGRPTRTRPGETTSLHPAPLVAPELTSGHNTLTFPVNADGSYGVRLQASGGTLLPVALATPATVYVCQGPALDPATHRGTGPVAGRDSNPTSANTLTAGYTAVTQTSATQVTATATLTSPAGTTFALTDVYAPSGTNMLTLTRTVAVTAVGTGSAPDTGFNSQFKLGFAGAPAPMGQYHFMAPAVLYDQNQSAPDSALATDLANGAKSWYYWRETRSGLPLVLVQDAATGTVLSVAHTGTAGSYGPVAASGADETSPAWLIDDSIQYAALGIEKVAVAGQANPQPTVGVVYPAAEGAVTYVGGKSRHWSYRSHPVYAGFAQHYAATFDLEQYANSGGTADFATALGQTYHAYYNLLAPTVAADNAAAIFQAGINLTKTLYALQGNGNGASYPGPPFSANIDGTAVKYSYEMGYTGTHLPLGFQLLRQGVGQHDAEAKTKGLAMLNFWATQDPIGMAAYGTHNLPLSWFEPNHPTQWSNTGCTVDTATNINQRPIFMREVAEGMESMAHAAVFARQQPAVGPQLLWEAFATQFGTWLLTHQDPAGSFPRAMDPHSGEACPGGGIDDATSPNNTTFPIRFLVQMWFATGNTAYRDAARAAGAYAWTHLYQPLVFTGGIISGNYEDREAGVQAMRAALALYDLEYQQDPSSAATQQWLRGAQIAGDFVETWQYVYDIHITDTTPTHAFAAYVYAGARATSLSTTGNSNGDIALSSSSFDFFRLHLLADDASQHYLHFAELLEYNTKLTTQLAVAQQQFSYLYDGFVTESVNLSNINFAPAKQINSWNGWLTNAELDPQQRLQDAFGNQSIRQLQQVNQATLQQQNHALYPAPGSLGWRP